MRLHAVGGLCNRLRAILSYLDEFGPPMHVVWAPDKAVAYGKFEDVFEPIPGVSFSTEGPFDVEDFQWFGHGHRPNWFPFRLLKPTQNVLDSCHAAKPVKPYKAVHIRRTDHTSIQVDLSQPYPDDAFFAFLDEDDAQPFYLATDNAETQRKYSSRYGSRCKTYADVVSGCEVQEFNNPQRHTDLFHAVVDLYVCADAGEFMGSPVSTFSETVNGLRGLR